MRKAEEIAAKYDFRLRNTDNVAEKIADTCLMGIYGQSPTVPMRTFVDAAVNEALEWAAQQCEDLGINHERPSKAKECHTVDAACIRAGKSDWRPLPAPPEEPK